MQFQKLKLGQQNNDKGSINLAGANKKATLKCKKIIIKTLAKLYQSVYCHSMLAISCFFFCQLHTSTSYYKYSIFPLAIVQWNALPETVACLPDLDSFKVAVSINAATY